MNRLAIVIVFLICCLASPLTAQVNTGAQYTTADHNKEIIAYFTQWDAWKAANAGLPAQGVFNQLNLDYSLYTMLNWSFLGVAQDGSLHSGDLRNKDIYQVGQVQAPGEMFYSDIYSSWDLWLLYGELEIIQYLPDNLDQQPTHASYWVYANHGYKGNGTGWINTNTGATGDYPLPLPKPNGAPGIIELCQNNGVKLMASIGGWSMCKHFPEMAADPVKRQNFLDDCVELINMGFDGIDIDWEYPNNPGMNIENYSYADYENFAILMEEIRAAIGPDKLITAAFSASPSNLGGFDWPRLAQSMDYFNMMSYDFEGGWSNNAGHNSALYGALSWDNTFSFLTSQGVSPSKINMGTAFYGRGVKTNGPASLGAPTLKSPANVQPDGPINTASDFTNWAVFDGTPSTYYVNQVIDNPANGWTKHWDNVAQVPYATKGDFFLSYSDEQSIGLKAQYVVDNNIAGVIIWQVFGDLEVGPITTTYANKLPYCPNTDAPQARKLNEVFANGNGGCTVQNQTITFSSIADKLTTDADFSISASSSSNLPVSFTIVSGPATISGNTISLTGTAGTVTVRASQAGNNCYNAAADVDQSFNVTQPTTPVVVVTVSAQDASCNGALDGSASASANGGLAPYTYSWSNDAAGDNISGLSAGNYSVTATDGDGNTGVGTVTVGQPVSLTANATGTNATDGASNGSVTATANGGTLPFTFDWGADGSGATITGLAPGTYSVTVTDANGCTAEASVAIG